MKQSEFTKIVERYRTFDNRSLVTALAESYGRRETCFNSLRYCRDAASVLKLSSDSEQIFNGITLGLKLVINYLSSKLEYEDKRIQAIMNVMEKRNFHNIYYYGYEFLVPDNWDMLDKSNPEYPPIDIEGVTK